MTGVEIRRNFSFRFSGSLVVGPVELVGERRESVGEALDPGLAAAAGAGLDEEVQAAAVAVSPGAAAGGDGADECGVEGALCRVRVPRKITR